jgi:hypothetical protein
MKPHLARILSLLLLLVVGIPAGCEERTLLKDDSPWCAPGKRAQHLSVQRAFQEHGNRAWWIDAQGGRLESVSAFQDCERYLATQPQWGTWPAYEGKTFVPYDLVLVSIRPRIVVMTPRPLGALSNDAFKQLVGQELSKPGMFAYPLDMKMYNQARYGTTVQYGTGMCWFSPELNQGIVPLSFDANGVAKVPVSDGNVVLRASGGTCSVSRD